MKQLNIQKFSNSDIVDNNTISYISNKPLLILDLDEVVIHTITSTQSTLNNTYKKPDWIVFEKADITNKFKDTYYHFFIRNGFLKFYNEIKKYYQVGIWSTANPDYVFSIVQNIFDNPNELSFIWSRQKSVEVIINKFSHTSDHQYRFVKDLIKLKRRGVRLKQTVIADDSPEKVDRQYGNLIPIKPYTAKSDDDLFTKLHTYLLNILHEENFKILEKRNWYFNDEQ
jgi:hypothetical protein